jgi:flagellar basal body P-ring formation protein FlgA
MKTDNLLLVGILKRISSLMKFHDLKQLRNQRVSVFICGLILVLPLSMLAQNKVEIRVSAESKVEKDVINLGDVAEISNGAKFLEFKNISLGYAPNVGMTREITRNRIALSIAAAGFAPKDYSLDSPKLVQIRRSGQKVEQSLIREIVKKSVDQQFGGSGVEVRIVRIDLPGTFEVTPGLVEIRTSLKNVANPFSSFSLPVEVRVDDRVVRRFSANVELQAFAEILVANSDLVVNSKISAVEVRVEQKRIEKPLSNFLRDLNDLRGKKLIKNLSNGSELTSDAFVASISVKSGDLVKIVGQSGKLQISINGEARSSGKIGDRIAVKNSQSNAIIQATIVDEGLVKVYF